MAITLFRAPCPALPDTHCLGELSQDGWTAQQSVHLPPAFLLRLLPGGAHSSQLGTGTDEDGGWWHQCELGFRVIPGQGGSIHLGRGAGARPLFIHLSGTLCWPVKEV